PAAALLGGAGLIVDQHGAAGNPREFLLHLLQVVAVVEGDALGPFDAGRIFLRLVADHDDAPATLGRDLVGDLPYREVAVVGLAAGHGDGVVVEDLVGDVDARGDRGADRHVAG